MRIIVTERGGDFIKSLGTEKIIEEISKGKVTPTKHLMTDENKDKSNNINKLMENVKNLKNLRMIEIKPKKLSIPKNIAEKYNEIKLDEPSLLPVLYQKITKSDIKSPYNHTMNTIMEENNSTKDVTNDTEQSVKRRHPLTYNNDDTFIKTSYKMKEIITEDALNNMKNNIVTDIKMKNRLSNVISTNFRSPFLTPIDKLNDIEAALDKKIKSDKANIIQYLNSKNNLSPKFVKSLSNYDEEKIVRLNKICQRVFNQDGQDSDLKTKINGIIDNMHVYQKADYKRKMNLMEKEVISIKNIFEKYPKRDDREKYENLLHDIKKKYWDKLGVDKLIRKNGKGDN